MRAHPTSHRFEINTGTNSPTQKRISSTGSYMHDGCAHAHRDTHTYIYIFTHTSIHTYIHYITLHTLHTVHTSIHTYVHTYIHALHTSIHTYIHTLHTSIHTYIHTYTYTQTYTKQRVRVQLLCHVSSGLPNNTKKENTKDGLQVSGSGG